MQSEIVVSLLAGIPLPVLVIGDDSRIKSCNAAAERIFGRGLMGRHYLTAMRNPALLNAIERALSTRTLARTRFEAVEAGRNSVYQVDCTPILGQGQTGIVVALEDISQVEAAGQIRRDFVANVSHELRTPLTALIGFIETLRGAARDDAAARDRFLGIMETEARRMNRLVDDLLSLSRVEAEERVRPTEPVDLRALAQSVVRSITPLAEQEHARIEIDDTGGDMTVPGDWDQLVQVFTNLVENAVKYGGQGVAVRVLLEPERYDAKLRTTAVALTVEDDGEGIDPSHIPRLTERFYRVDSHRSREMGGTGLGLAIAKHILNRHRGRLEIASQQGVGSRFSGVLPTG